jgi:hypothetical protein
MKVIDGNSSFAELKEWFDSLEYVPQTLDGAHIFYKDVRWSVQDIFLKVIKEIEKVGIDGMRQSKQARYLKLRLYKLYKDLQKPENFNKKISEISN